MLARTIAILPNKTAYGRREAADPAKAAHHLAQ